MRAFASSAFTAENARRLMRPPDRDTPRMKQPNRPLGPVTVCLISAVSAIATTLVLRSAETHTSAPDCPRLAAAPEKSDDLGSAALALRAEVAATRDASAATAPPVADRTPVQLAQPASDVHTKLASLEAQIAQLLQAQKEGDLRTKLVASRHQTQMAGARDLDSRLEARAKNYSLSATQVEAMRQMEMKWRERDVVVLRLWERGADLTTLQHAITQDDAEYQREFDNILTSDQRHQRDVGTATFRLGRVTR